MIVDNNWTYWADTSILFLAASLVSLGSSSTAIILDQQRYLVKQVRIET